jgi:hypothetical protein
MDNKGLLFIPDISGFTRFVNETEIEHSRVIIQELLELLINANQIGLEISEIEGDAILFYKFGESPDVVALYHQVAAMFRAFHRHINAYEDRRYCKCQACNSAINLTLKVITHYGEFTGYNVKNFNKLIGKDIIVAHQLLKNDIEQHEYWLVTDELINDDKKNADLPEWLHWNSSVRETEIGGIPFRYAPLSELKKELPAEPAPVFDLSSKSKMISVTTEYDGSILQVFHAAGDFNFRHRWQEGVRAVEEVDHFLPRVGMRCRYVMDNGEAIIYSSSYNYSPAHIEYSETEDVKRTTTYYTIESLAPKRTRLTIDYYIPKNPIAEIFFVWTKKENVEKALRKSLQNLDKIVKEIRIPEEQEG